MNILCRFYSLTSLLAAHDRDGDLPGESSPSLERTFAEDADPIKTRKSFVDHAHMHVQGVTAPTFGVIVEDGRAVGFVFAPRFAHLIEGRRLTDVMHWSAKEAGKVEAQAFALNQDPSTRRSVMSLPTVRDSGMRMRRAELLTKLVEAANGETLRSALAAYEASGDHDHGRGPIAPGAHCGNGADCWVARARASLAAIEALNHPINHRVR